MFEEEKVLALEILPVVTISVILPSSPESDPKSSFAGLLFQPSFHPSSIETSSASIPDEVSNT